MLNAVLSFIALGLWAGLGICATLYFIPHNESRKYKPYIKKKKIINCLIFVRKSKDDSWVSNGTYMDLRKEPGFSKLDNPVLW